MAIKKMTIKQRLDAIQFSKESVDQFTNGYLECLLWASPGLDSGAELDSKYKLTNLTHESLDRIVAECKAWYKENEKLLVAATNEIPHRDFSHHGHDFYLSRNHHGTGFFDRGYSPKLSDTLQHAAEDAGSRCLLPCKGKLYYEHG